MWTLRKTSALRLFTSQKTRRLPTSAINAAKLTMAKSGIDPKEIDLIIDFTSIPEDYVAPTWSAAGQVQKEIGATRAFATAINTGGCASLPDHIESRLLVDVCQRPLQYRVAHRRRQDPGVQPQLLSNYRGFRRRQRGDSEKEYDQAPHFGYRGRHRWEAPRHVGYSRHSQPQTRGHRR